MHRRTIVLGSAALLASPAIARAQSAPGVALVIGNSKYRWEAPLPNVRRDAPDVARRFQALGLRTELVQDAGREAMRAALDKFVASAAGARLAAFYFAGHGVITEGTQFLVPADADLTSPDSIRDFKFTAVAAVGRALATAQHRLLALDCCRNNPSDGWRQQAAADLASSKGTNPDPPDTMVLFSTAPGRVALDGPPGENSPFAAAFLRQFEGATVDLRGLPPRLRRDLLLATEGRQFLWARSNFRQEFAIAGVTGAATGGAKGGWARDPSRLLELDKAYEAARQLNLPMLGGLVAHRPPAGSPDAAKVGSFRFERGNQPAIAIVLSVEERQAAELFLTTRTGGSNQPYFAFLRGTVSGDQIEFIIDSRSWRHVLKWSDANSGSVTLYPTVSQGDRIVSSRFRRLD